MHTPAYRPDSLRFLDQAESLLDGRGYTWQGQPDASLPPGYPVFISAVFAVRHSHAFLRLAQLGLSLASCYLVFFALKPRSERLAAVALLLMSLSPWTGRLMCSIMSETLGIFLCSLLVFFVSRYELGARSWGHHFVIGLLCTALLLTSPATIFLAFGIFCAIAWYSRHRRAGLLFLGLGGLLLMAPWQAYCHYATGRLQPTVIADYSRNNSYSYSWS